MRRQSIDQVFAVRFSTARGGLVALCQVGLAMFQFAGEGSGGRNLAVFGIERLVAGRFRIVWRCMLCGYGVSIGGHLGGGPVRNMSFKRLGEAGVSILGVAVWYILC